jgi:peptide deformylase
MSKKKQPQTQQIKPPKIVQNGEAVLRDIAKPVPIKDITTPHIQKLIADMKSALDPEKDGVALAAPQIGVPLRIFIISGLILAAADERYAPKDKLTDMVFINPEIIKTSKEKEDVEEGCLSVRYLYGKISRAKKVTLRAYDEHGRKVERGASGLLAQIFQHETDHLNGVLFIDRARDIQEILPENLNR